jgi:hypothetical protein
VRKFSAVPNVTGRELQPRGVTNTGPTLENGRDGWSYPIGICIFLKAARLMSLRAAPPSIKTWYIFDVGDARGDQKWELIGTGHALGAVRGVEPNRGFHPLVVWCHFRRRSRRRDLPAQGLDDTPGRDGPGASEHDVERLAALIVTGLRVRVAIDGLQCPLGLLKLHLCVFLLLGVDLLLALPLAGRRAILALLQLFTELFHELLDLPALRPGMACGVMHRALCAAVVAIGRLKGAFATTAPTRRCSCGSGCPSQRLVTTSLLVVVISVAIATALGLALGAGRGALPFCLLGGWGVPGVAFHSPGALVHQAEERGHILDVVGGELLQHLFIPYPLAKCNHYRSIGDTRNGIANLREPLDERAQGFPQPLLDGVEIGLVTRPGVGALEVGRKLAAQL